MPSIAPNRGTLRDTTVSRVEKDWKKVPTSAKPVSADFGTTVASICTSDKVIAFTAKETSAIPSKRRVKLDNKQHILTTDLLRSPVQYWNARKNFWETNGNSQKRFTRKLEILGRT